VNNSSVLDIVANNDPTKRQRNELLHTCILVYDQFTFRG